MKSVGIAIVALLLAGAEVVSADNGSEPASITHDATVFPLALKPEAIHKRAGQSVAEQQEVYRVWSGESLCLKLLLPTEAKGEPRVSGFMDMYGGITVYQFSPGPWQFARTAPKGHRIAHGWFRFRAPEVKQPFTHEIWLDWPVPPDGSERFESWQYRVRFHVFPKDGPLPLGTGTVRFYWMERDDDSIGAELQQFLKEQGQIDSYRASRRPHEARAHEPKPGQISLTVLPVGRYAASEVVTEPVSPLEVLFLPDFGLPEGEISYEARANGGVLVHASPSWLRFDRPEGFLVLDRALNLLQPRKGQTHE